MKKGVSGVFIVLFLVSMLSFAFNLTDVRAEPVTAILYAGQTIPVGTVDVWNDGGNLYVTYTTTGGWRLAETHLAVATDPCGIPKTKTGNPIPGKFAYSMVHDPVTTTTYTYTIPLTWSSGTPLTIAAHAEVIKLIGTAATWQYATQVVAYQQGTLVGGGPITDPLRMNPNVALGPPDGSTSPPATGFYSLGFVSIQGYDGYIVLGFSCPIYNGPNPDVRTVEITWGRPSYPREAAKVYAIVGSMEYYLGTVTNHDSPTGSSYVSFDAVPAGVYIDAIKLVDDTYKSDFPIPPQANVAADGYDLDAVGVRYLVQAEETAWGAGLGFPGANWATYIEYTVQGWNVEGDWVIRVYYGATYDHDFTFTAVQTGGTFEGTGGYPASGPPYVYTETVTGTVTGNTIDFVSTYNTGYWWHAVGTIAPDGTMSGTWTSSTGQAGTWASISGHAVWE